MNDQKEVTATIRRVWAALFVIFLITNIATQAQDNKTGEAGAVGEIRAVLDKQVDAWNRRDLEGFMVGYWQSPNLTFYSGGTKTRSWQETIDRYRKRYQSAGTEMGRLNFSEIEIEVLSADSAYVRGKWRLQMKDANPGGLFTLIFRKLPAGWRIIHDHTSSE